MKNRFIIVYTVFAAAVFIFALSFFGFNLYKEYSTNLNKSETRYTNLVNDIRTLSYNQAENTTAFSQAIKNAVGDAEAYSFIQVRRDGETVVFYPAGKLKEETVSRLTRSFSTSLTVNKQAVTVDCNIYLIRPDSIFYYARVSFLMILIITIITVIMIIYLNMVEANTTDVISFEEEEENSETENSLDETETDEETITEKPATEENPSDESISEETENEAVTVTEESEEITENTAASAQKSEISEAAETIEEQKTAEVTPEEVRAILAEPLTDEQTSISEPETKIEKVKLPVEEIKPAKTDSIPSGLFDSVTGIGWESYLLTRLNNEIERATASEIDISLFVIKVPGIEKTSEVFRNICNYLAIQFQFKDLLFEYKDDSIVAMKISMNIDEALNLADKLYSDICNLINGTNCRIGITSRSIRMVTGERLLMEAEQSLEHSDADSPIIAFRVDSEKYRQMMEQY